MLLHHWIYDQLFDGRRLWGLTKADSFSRFSPGVWVGFQAKVTGVIGALNAAVTEIGMSKRIRVDNGSLFISKEMDFWAYANGVVLDFSRPGKPTDNAFIEDFNGRFRLERLNQHWFLDPEDARSKIEACRQDYNHVRPHESICKQAPISGATSSPRPKRRSIADTASC